jgi:hypothetical protein
MVKPKKKKEPVELQLCKCGCKAVCVRCKGENWKVVCLNPHCDVAVRGFDTAEEAIKAFNEEVREK